MSKYVLAFRGQPDRQPARDETEAWGRWLGGLGAKIVDPGNRVGQVERLNAEPAGSAASEVLTGYVVVDAADTTRPRRSRGGARDSRPVSASRSPRRCQWQADHVERRRSGALVKGRAPDRAVRGDRAAILSGRSKIINEGRQSGE